MDISEEDNKFVRVDPADPTRCQTVGQNGEQCPFQGKKSDQNTYMDRCALHFGGVRAASMRKQAQRIYHLEKYRDRINRLSDVEVSHNLDDELGIQRMLLENLLDKATPVELVTQAPQMSLLIRDIRDTLVANKKIKSAYGELMDREAINRLCDHLVVVIAKYVTPEQLDNVSQDVAAAIATAVATRLGE